MRERERLLWNLLIILLLIIAAYMGYNVYRMGRQVREYQVAMESEVLGSGDPQLRATVEQLESDLRDRMAYTFKTDHDPLDLTQVIQGQRFLSHLGFSESFESYRRMRLSCTVIAENSAAVIKYQGRSRILRIGDVLDGYRLVEIEPQRAVMDGPDGKLELVTEKAPETLERERQIREGLVSVSAVDTLSPQENY